MLHFPQMPQLRTLQTLSLPPSPAVSYQSQWVDVIWTKTTLRRGKGWDKKAACSFNPQICSVQGCSSKCETIHELTCPNLFHPVWSIGLSRHLSITFWPVSPADASWSLPLSSHFLLSVASCSWATLCFVYPAGWNIPCVEHKIAITALFCLVWSWKSHSFQY